MCEKRVHQHHYFTKRKSKGIRHLRLALQQEQQEQQQFFVCFRRVGHWISINHATPDR